jgi:hypothetical protein
MSAKKKRSSSSIEGGCVYVFDKAAQPPETPVITDGSTPLHFTAKRNNLLLRRLRPGPELMAAIYVGHSAP